MKKKKCYWKRLSEKCFWKINIFIKNDFKNNFKTIIGSFDISTDV